MRKIFLSFVGIIISSVMFGKAYGVEITDTDKRVNHSKQILEVLNIGQELLGDTLFKQVGMVGDYYRYKTYELQTQLQTQWKDSTKYPAVEELEKAELEVERLEQELIIESVKIFAVNWRKNWTKPNSIEYTKKKNKELQDEIEKVIQGWQVNVEELARNGIKLDISIETERIKVGKEEAFTGLVPDRLFEQRYGFYKAISTERQRIANGVIRCEQELETFKKTISQITSKLPDDIDMSVVGAKREITRYRDAVNRSSYLEQVRCEKKAQELLNNLKTAITVK